MGEVRRPRCLQANLGRSCENHVGGRKAPIRTFHSHMGTSSTDQPAKVPPLRRTEITGFHPLVKWAWFRDFANRQGGGEGLGIGDWALGAEEAESGRLEVGAWLGWLDHQCWPFGLDWWHLSLGIG